MDVLNFRTSKFCKSAAWNISDLSGLGLLGFTPCFEDICLLTPVHLAIILLACHRIIQIWSKYYNHTEEFKLRQYLKVILSVANAILYTGKFPLV